MVRERDSERVRRADERVREGERGREVTSKQVCGKERETAREGDK